MIGLEQEMVCHTQGLKNFAVRSPIFRFFITASVIIAVDFSHNILAERGLIVVANLCMFLLSNGWFGDDLHMQRKLA